MKNFMNIFFALFLVLSFSVEAKDLFEFRNDTDSSHSYRALGTDAFFRYENHMPGEIASSRVRVDGEVLLGSSEGDQISFALADNAEKFNLTIKDVSKDGPTYSYHTLSKDGAVSAVFTVGGGGAFLGKIDTVNLTYFISGSAGEYVFKTLKEGRILDLYHDTFLSDENSYSSRASNSSRSGNGEVRLLFIASTATWNEYWWLLNYHLITPVPGGGSVGARLDPKVMMPAFFKQLFNASLRNSGVNSNNKIEIAGVREISDDYPYYGECRSFILNKMNTRARSFTNIDQWMDQAQADVAIFVPTTRPNQGGYSCVPGYGRVGGVANMLDPSTPFAMVTSTYLLGTLTGLHELGHLFGGQHHNDNEVRHAYSSYSRGFLQFPSCNLRTIMGDFQSDGSAQCNFSANSTRIDYWSSPNIYRPDPTTGQSVRIGGANADMVRTLNQTMPIVSGWR